MKRLLDVGLTLIVLHLVFLGRFSCDLAGVSIVSFYSIFSINLIEIHTLIFVYLSQFFLELSLLFVEINQVLLYERLNVDLHVMSGN